MKKSSVDINKIEASLFLSKHKIWPQLYVKNRENGHERIAIGSVYSSNEYIDLRAYDEEITVYCIESFSLEASSSPLWSSSPRCLYFIPKHEIIQNESKTTLNTYSLSGDTASIDVNFDPEENFLKKATYLLQDRSDTPNSDQWILSIQRALDAIKNKNLDKVVLARKTAFICGSKICPYRLLKHLKKTQKNTTIFSFATDSSKTFLGSSPEKLYKRHLELLTTEALAGTVTRGKNAEEDVLFQAKLRSSEKLLSEVSFVEQFLKEKLNLIARDVDMERSFTVKQTLYVQHLYKKIQCILPSNFSDHTAIGLLHPTPALSGLPQKKAMNFIKDIEPFDRGWYGGIIGFYDRSEADFTVAIRSCLIQDNTLFAFAGAGIVDGSDPIEEWNELESKIKHYKEYFS